MTIRWHWRNFVPAVVGGKGVLATSSSDHEELRRVAMAAIKAFDNKPSISNATTHAAEPTTVPAMPAA
jgi:hypothetical protein